MMLIFSRIPGYAAYICLLCLGLVRIGLEIDPFKFHTMRHQALAGIMIPLIFSIPAAELVIMKLKCDSSCNSQNIDLLAELYGKKLNINGCALYLPLLLIGALLLVYVAILVLEYKRLHREVRPPALTLGHQEQPQPGPASRLSGGVVYSVSGNLEARLPSPHQASISENLNLHALLCTVCTSYMSNCKNLFHIRQKN